MQLADRKQYGALHWGKKGAIVKLQDKDMNYDFNKEVYIYIPVLRGVVNLGVMLHRYVRRAAIYRRREKPTQYFEDSGALFTWRGRSAAKRYGVYILLSACFWILPLLI
jgi:hypothetical protein